ncbi:suv3 RNA helicase [Ptiloglossa arizonensis]|uniref:suv3 RNA helicase n=1 Tax=Ptiloglossa arizonensis TaxID=3350558 RepID=UPI003FA0F9FF
MIPLKNFLTDQLKRRNNSLISPFLRYLNPTMTFTQNIKEKHGKSNESISSLFSPVPIKSNSNDENIGVELTRKLNKANIIQVLHTFSSLKVIQELALKYGLDHILFNKVFVQFRQYCIHDTLPVDLHIVLNDIILEAANVSDIFPYFLRYAKEMYPHIDCLDDLKRISDLRHPPNWYPLARKNMRKIIFHAGPTNSGKTYHALKRFMAAKSGVYCGPLKLLASEIFYKSNTLGTPCDLITGEEKRYVQGEMSPSNHIACSVEMVNLEKVFEVAIIDEIQLIRDPNRGWAWTRAFLGIIADEIHLCGESAAIPLVQSICATIGENVEVLTYKRLTSISIENSPGSFENIRRGDCIVCFNKSDIFTVSQTIENMGKMVAVIYGSLPPGTKLAQTARFNDVNNPCKILVATNAIGMGLNLHIGRIVFYSLCQPTLNEKGEKEIDTISVSSALQIAGRAGRYNTQWKEGFVTTFKPEDLHVLKQLLSQEPEPIIQAGLHPTADQIELYAYHLPNTPLSKLIDIFIALSEVDDSLYFICNLDDFKFLADMIQHIPLSLRTRYVFCCAPITKNMPFVCSMFVKYARLCSKNEPVTVTWMTKQIQWPPEPPGNISDLIHLETVFDVMDVYLWLSYRFMDLFPHATAVRNLQRELDIIIEKEMKKLNILFKKSETGASEKGQTYFNKEKLFGKGKLTNTLINEGLLTPKLIKQLHAEWSMNVSDEKIHAKSSNKENNYYRRHTKRK